MHLLLIALVGIDLVGTIAGVYAVRTRGLGSRFVTVSGGLMLGIGLFWVWPDLAQSTGIVHSLLSVSVAIACLYGIDRYFYPICPCCTCPENFCPANRTTIAPLVIAICIHNAFDGFCAGITEHLNAADASAILAGLLAHKLPEGLLFGMMLRSAAMNSRVAARSALLTAATIIPGALAHDFIPLLSISAVVYSSLALACGSFLFLGVHIAVRRGRDTGIRPALLSTGLGVLFAVVIERGVSVLFAAP